MSAIASVTPRTTRLVWSPLPRASSQALRFLPCVGSMALVPGAARRGAADPPGYQCGDRLLIFYRTEVVHHERIVLSPAVPPNYYIVTPDGDMYAEPLSPPPLTSVHRLPANRTLPRGVLRRNCFMFEPCSFGRDLSAAKVQVLADEGRRFGNLDRIAAGLPPTIVPGALVAGLGGAAAALPPGVPAAGLPLPAVPLDAQLVSMECVHDLKIGSPIEAIECMGSFGSRHIVRTAAGHVVLARVVPVVELPALVEGAAAAMRPAPAAAKVDTPRAAAELEDARTLPVRYDLRGERHREVRDAVDRMAETAFTDWPIKGPRTAKWVLRYGVENGCSLSHMHVQWKAALKLTEADHGVTFHESICRVLHLATTYDQLNIPELACFEALARSLQMVHWKWRERAISSGPGGLDDASYFFFGSDSSRGKLCIAPAMQDYITDELHKEALASKEARQAREERALLRGPKK